MMMRACEIACNRVIKLTVRSPRVSWLEFSMTKLLAFTPVIVLSHYQCSAPLLRHMITYKWTRVGIYASSSTAYHGCSAFFLA